MLRIRWRELLRMQCHALKNITLSLYESNITHSCNFIHLRQLLYFSKILSNNNF